MYDYESNPEAKGVEYQVTKVDPTDPETKGMVYQVHKVSEEIAATLGGKVYRARIINDPTEPTVAGKVYQIVLIGDPTDPAVKGKVYNAILTGGSEAVVVGPAVSPLNLPDAIANSLSYVKAFGGTEQNGTPTPDAPVDIVSNNGVLKARHQSGLPLGYTLLEYIESTGTQYIDTGLKLTQDNTVEVEYNYHTASNIATSGRMFGARYTSSPRWSFSLGSNSGYASSAIKTFAQFGNADRLATNNITIGQWGVYKMSADGFYIDGVLQGSFPATTFETPFTVKLFAFEQASSSSGTPTVGGGVGRCRRFKVYQGDTLVMDLIPAKNPTDDIGMYDLIRGQFFTNQGTGDFVAGATVNDIEVYADGTVETIEDTIGNTATAEMLLKVGDYQDEQEILSGVVTRKVGVLVLDGTENWSQPTTGSVIRFAITNPTGFDIPQNSNMHAYCNILVDGGYQTSGTTLQKGTFSYAKTTARYLRMAPNNGITTVEGWQQWLADQYAAGTPVIVVFPLATPTTESVAGQTLQVMDGDNVVEITQASLSNLELEAEYEKEAE